MKDQENEDSKDKQVDQFIRFEKVDKRRHIRDHGSRDHGKENDEKTPEKTPGVVLESLFQKRKAGLKSYLPANMFGISSGIHQRSGFVRVLDFNPDDPSCAIRILVQKFGFACEIFIEF